MLRQEIKKLSKAYHKEVIGLRRDLHTYPELSFEEYETSKYVQAFLKKNKIPFKNNIANTGVVAMIKGNEGVMHACGHDVHTASLLGACKILNEVKGHFSGSIKCIFQPAEEKIPGGAKWMIKEGVLKNPKPKSIFGQHVHPPLAVGKVGFKAGTYMASADEINLRVTGRGGHAAIPQDFIDPIVIGSNIIIALQQVVSRGGDPTIPNVLSFGKFESDGGSFNVIPNSVSIAGTFRTMNEKWRKKAHRMIKDIASNTAKAHGARCDVEILAGYPSLKNDPKLTAEAMDYSRAYMGKSNVIDLPKRMTAEDFSYFSQVTTACFYRLGTGNKKKKITSPVHTPTFNVDEDSLTTGMGLMAWLALCELGN